MEEKFKSDMLPPEESEQVITKQSAWYSKYPMAVNKVASFDIKPEVNCLIQDLFLD